MGLAVRNYLQQRKYKRNGSVTSGAYFYQRRVPKDLRHRTDIFKSQFIEEYLGTTDRTAAGRKVSAVNEKWERIFDAMRRDEKITEEQLERIRLAAQFQAHGAMMADPLDGPNEVADALEQFLPNVEADSRKYLERAGLDCSERNLNEAMRAIWIGTIGAQALFNQGLTPSEPPSYEPLMFDTSGPGGPTILEATEAYEKSTDVTTTEKTRRQLKQSARLFADHVGQQKPVTALTGKDAVAFLDRLAKINPDYRRDPKSGELTLAELEEFYPSKEGKGLSAATINRHAGHLRVLIGWLIKRHELPEEHRNPFAGKSRSIKNWNGDGGQGGGYLPMSDSEIAALLKDAMLGRDFGQNFNACIGWLVLIGAFTGARAGELCALTKDDVREKDEIPFIAIRSGKTENATRVVPLQPS